MHINAPTGSALGHAAASCLVLALAAAGCRDDAAAWQEASRKTTISGTVSLHLQQIGDGAFEDVKLQEHVRLSSGETSYALFIPMKTEVVGLPAAEPMGPKLRDYFLDHPAAVCKFTGCLIDPGSGLPDGLEPSVLAGMAEPARAEAEQLKKYCEALQRFSANRDFLFPPVRRGPEPGSIKTEGALAMDETPVRVFRVARVEIAVP